MRFDSVVIESLGCALPDEAVTSAQIEEQLRPVYERLRLPFGRLELMTGVRERRFFPPGTRPSAIATAAGERALAASNVPRESIGMLLHCSVCRDFVEPATASVVHHALGLPASCAAFDLSNACLGVLNGVTLLGQLIDAGRIDAGLLVSGENGRDLVETTIRELVASDTTDRQQMKRAFASLTIGAAGVAVVVSRDTLARDPQRRRLRAATVRTASQHHALCTGDSGSDGTRMATDSEALLLAGVELAAVTWPALCGELGWQPGGLDARGRALKFIGHQVGVAHRRALFARLGLDTARDFSTFETLGNVGSAAAPLTLLKADEAGFLAPGDPVALLGIGSGLHCLMLALDW